MRGSRRWRSGWVAVVLVVCAAGGARARAEDTAASKQAAALAEEKARGKAFLDEAAKEPGAVKTKSGFVYLELEKGTGPRPWASNKVKVHYVGKLVDGKVFDSSVARGEPAVFALKQVIRCWTEGLLLMKAGGKAKLVCPPELAYGDGGMPGAIPGGATLVFEVQLLSVVDAM